MIPAMRLAVVSSDGPWALPLKASREANDEDATSSAVTKLLIRGVTVASEAFPDCTTKSNS